MTALEGKWKMSRSENLDEYLKEMGIGFMPRKVLGTFKPNMELQVAGDGNSQVTIKMDKWKDIQFTVGESFTQETPGGDKVECVGEWQENKLVVKGKEKGRESVTTREIVGDELVMTTTTGDVTCKRFFKKC